MKKTFLMLLLVSAYHAADAQEKIGTQKVLYFSAGPNYYLNNFDYFREAVDQSHISLGARLMWEGPHRLALGVKSGFYWIYSVEGGPTTNNGKINLTGIPIEPCISMKFFDDFHVTYGIGPTLLFNNIEADQGQVFSDSFLSTADMSLSVGYAKKINEKNSFGVELEYFRSSKAQDNLFSLSFLYRLPMGRKARR